MAAMMTRGAALALHDVGQAHRIAMTSAPPAPVASVRADHWPVTRRAGWMLPRVVIGACLVVAAYSLVTLLTDPRFVASAGWDFALYRDAAARWVHGGAFYPPDQVAGPYDNRTGILYPPPVLLLFVPFTVLPAFLWWAVPFGIVAWRVWVLRPSPWAWAGIAACVAWPLTVEMVYNGNPVIWIVAALALATRWPWVSVFVLAKPSLFPFAFVGARHRSWWLALSACALISALFLPMWPDWIAAVLNARGPFSGPLYSLRDVPLLAIPLVAWAARPKRCRSTSARPSR